MGWMTKILLIGLVGCSSSSSTAASSGTPYDAGVSECEGGRCFTCDTATCAEGSYCQSTFPGTPGAAAMGACMPLPSKCASTPTCACVGETTSIDHCAAAPDCFDDGAGHVMLQCHYY